MGVGECVEEWGSVGRVDEMRENRGALRGVEKALPFGQAKPPTTTSHRHFAMRRVMPCDALPGFRNVLPFQQIRCYSLDLYLSLLYTM